MPFLESAPSSVPWSTVRRAACALLVVLIVAVAYGPVFAAGFVYDDQLVVLRDPAIAHFDVSALLTQPLWDFYSPEAAASVGYWRPGASLVLALTYALAGPSATAFHVVSLALHAAAACAAWVLARRIARSDAVGFAVALLFAVHPVHVESVAWISAIGDPAFGLCALLALERHLAWRESDARGESPRTSPWAAGALLLAGLAAKELAVGVVLAVLVLDFAGGYRVRDWRAYKPYIAALAVYVVARMFVFHSVWGGFDRTTTEFGVTAGRLMLLRAEILGLGVRFAVWPTDLRLFHPFAPDASQGGLAVPLAACAAWIALCIWLAWCRQRALFAAAALVLAPLAVLVLRVGALGQFPFSERYLYLPVFGIALFWVLLARHFLPSAVGVALLAIATAAGAWATRAQAKTWHDDDVLFRTAVERSPRTPYAHIILGRNLLERYRTSSDPELLREASREFDQALALLLAAQRGDGSILGLSDDHVQANVGLGWSMLYITEADGTRDFAPAEEVFRMAAERYPTSEEAWTGLGVARMERHDLAGAEEAFANALRQNDRFVEARRNLGRLHMQAGDYAAARAAFEEALRYEPDGVDTLLLLGGSLERSGDDAGARARFDRAAELAPRDARPHVQRAILDAKAGRTPEARRELDIALELDPSNSEAYLTRGKIQAANGEKNGALVSFRRACDLAPNSFEAHYNAGILTLQLESVPQAMPYLLRAYESQPDATLGKQLGDAIRNLPLASSEAFLQLATSDADRNDFDGALAWIANALELQPEDGPTLYLQGAMRREKGDLAGARESLRKAVAQMPENFTAQDALAGVLAQLGDKAGALEHSREALRILEKAATGSEEYDQTLQLLRRRIDSLSKEG